MMKQKYVTCPVCETNQTRRGNRGCNACKIRKNTVEKQFLTELRKKGFGRNVVQEIKSRLPIKEKEFKALVNKNTNLSIDGEIIKQAKKHSVLQ